MSTFAATLTALSALRMAERVSAMAAQNIANADTPGYARLVEQNTEAPGGSGVNTKIVSTRDPYLDIALSAAQRTSAESRAVNRGLEDLDQLFTNSNLAGSYDEFMAAAQEAQINPDDPIRVNNFGVKGQSFANSVQRFQTDLGRLVDGITIRLNLTQIELNNVQSELESLAARPVSEEIKTQISALTNRAQVLSGSINGFNKLLGSIIPPISTAFLQSKNTVFDAINQAYGQEIIDADGKWKEIGPGRFDAVMSLDKQFVKDLAGQLTAIGAQSEAASQQNTLDQAFAQSIADQVQAAQGVDLVSEIVKLQRYQRVYEAAAQVIKTQNEMIGTLLNTIA